MMQLLNGCRIQVEKGLWLPGRDAKDLDQASSVDKLEKDDRRSAPVPGMGANGG